MKSALEKIPDEIYVLIEKHMKDLEEAWANCAAEDALSISFPVKIGCGGGKGLCEVGISFSKAKVKDRTTFSWSDQQLDLLKPVTK